MGEQPIWVTVIVNRLLGDRATALLGALHIKPSNPDYPIPNHISMEIFVFILAAIFFLWLRRHLSADRPGTAQLCMEMLLTNPMGVGVKDLIQSNLPHGGEKYLPMIGSIGIFVLFSNLISVIPTLESPTANSSVPLGCAIIVFIYYNFSGVATKGPLGYAKHFLGPNIFLSPLWVVVEIVSNLARLLSLTVRLWVNMMVSEMLYVIFLGLMLGLALFVGKLNPAGYIFGVLPLIGPVVFVVLHIVVAFLQAFVFTILPVIYVAGAVEEAH
ncbi:MAG TPA: F0F1 ATP synthase subunit A [Verrucomicrobiae bacterium]|jgi:F-type H+-transporting ATPase subunit a|nr:F0F1 ATP synthase subunit A [Verrucomicrobiae bacterium]